jgi:N-acetylgalactosamine kinase
VNLIGEHIDYCGYPVLPMAIEQTILCAAIPTNDDVLLLKNFNDKYEAYESSINAFE